MIIVATGENRIKPVMFEKQNPLDIVSLAAHYQANSQPQYRRPIP